MVAIVGGSSLGLNLGSLAVLGEQGARGSALTGRNGEMAYVNAVTGNLVLQGRDEYMAGRGLSMDSVRTYNSQGLFNDADNGDNWSLGFYKQQLKLIGTLNATGSTFVRTDRDGSQATYTYVTTGIHAGKYRTTEGAGAHDLIEVVNGNWRWTDGTTGNKELYLAANGRLASMEDLAGNRIAYEYTEGKLTSARATEGERTDTTYYEYVGNNLSSIRTVISRVGKPDVERSRVQYAYDNDRLWTVTVDLTPEDGGDSQVYRTDYRYDGASKRVNLITQSDGSSLTIRYDSAQRVESVEDGLAQRTSFNYEAGVTTVTDPLLRTSRYYYNSKGNLSAIYAASLNGAPRQIAAFDYYPNSDDVFKVYDGEGRGFTYYYDSRGNQERQHDKQGNTVTRTFGANNRLLTETQYLQPDTDGSGPIQPTAPLTTRYVYDTEGRGELRFVISPQGRVTEYRYDSFGQRKAELVYTDKRYEGVDNLGVAVVPTLADMNGFVAGHGGAKIQRTDMSYERGLLRTTTQYVTTDSSGEGVRDGTQSTTEFVYSQDGLLLQTISPKQVSTVYTYDGMGRRTSSTDGTNQSTITLYDDAQGKTVVTLANGLVSTSTFDKAGRLTSLLQSGAGVLAGETQYFYDANGNLRMTQDPTGVRQWKLYDEVGRKVAEIDGNGTLTEYVYNRKDQLTKAILYEKPVNLTALVDGSGKPTAVALATIRPATGAKRETSYRYDNVGAGRLDLVTDPSGVALQTVYDGSSSRVLQQIQIGTGGALQRVTRHLYDKDSRLLATLDPEGHFTEHEYDAAGRLTRTLRRATAVAVGLRAAGTLEELRLSAGETARDIKESFEYNGKGQLIRHIDGENFVTERRYDLNGNLKEEIRFGERETQFKSWTHDALNRVETATDVDGTVTRYVYDSVGNLLSTTRAVGQLDARSIVKRYDLRGRVTAELSGVGAAQLAALPAVPTPAAVEAIWDRHAVKHGYDAAGRLISSTDQNGLRSLFFYNVDNQLTHTVNARGEVEELRYNSFSQVEATIRYGSKLTAAGLNGGLVTSNLTNAINALANAAKDGKTQVFYDAAGRVASHLYATGYRDVYEYNAYSELARTHVSTNAAGDAASAVRVDSYAYDNRGLKTGITRNTLGLAADQITTSTQYDAFGRVTSFYDGNGKLQLQEFDRLGRMVSSTDAMLIKRKTSYDAFSRILSQTDALNQVTTYSHNTAQRSLTVTTPEGVSVTTVSNSHGQTLSITDGNSQTTSYEYNADGQLKLTHLPRAGGVVAQDPTRIYDDAGRLTETTDERGTKVKYEYNEANRLITRTVDPGGLNLVTQYDYDYRGNQVSVTDPQGTVTLTEYDLASRVLKHTVDPSGLNHTTSYAYNALGTVLRVTNPKLQVTEYEYDAHGRRTLETIDPTGLALKTRYTYDKNGNVLTRTDANQQLTRFAYDAENRLLFSVDPLGHTSRNEYDDQGRLTRSTRYAQPLANLGSLPNPATDAEIFSRLQASPGRDAVEARRYDKDGRVSYTVDGNGAVVKFKYDGNGNVIERRAYASTINLAAWAGLSDPAPSPDDARDQLTRTSYDALNRATHVADALGLVTERQYDGRGNVLRVVQHATRIGQGAEPSSVASSGGDRSSVFVYDRADRQIWQADASGAVTRTEYDDVNNVTTTTRFAIPITAGGDPAGVDTTGANRVSRAHYDRANRLAFSVDALNYVTEQSYDKLGNVESVTRFASDIADGAAPSSVARNAALDRTDRYTYDAAGRLETHTDAEGGVERYSYQGLNKKTYTNQKQAVWTYTYDAAGRVESEVSPAVELVNSQGEVVTAGIETRYEYDGLGQLLSRTEAKSRPEERTTHYEYDARGHQVKTIFPPVGVYDPSADSPANGLNGEAERVEQMREGASALFTRTLYDAFGQAVANVDVAGSASYKAYDQAGRLAYEVDALGQVTGYERNKFGEAEAVTRYAQALPHLVAVVAHAAADAPSLISIESAINGALVHHALDRVLRTEFDQLGRARQITEPATDNFDSRTNRFMVGQRVTIYDFNAFGEIERTRISSSTEAHAGSLVTRHFFDRLGRETTTVDTLGYVTKREYDARGNLTLVAEYANAAAIDPGTEPGAPASATKDRITRFGFDRLDRKTSQTRIGVTVSSLAATTPSSLPAEPVVFDGSANLLTSYGYDAVGNLTRTTEPNGANVYSYYDALGRVTAVVTPEAKTVDGTDVKGLSLFRRDAYGNVVLKQDLANGALAADEVGFAAGVSSAKDRTTRTTFDAMGRAIEVVDAEEHARLISYTARGEVAKTWQTVTASSGAMGTIYQKFAYDKLGQLTHTYTPAPFSGLNAVADHVDSSAEYNAFGEVTRRRVNGAETEYFDIDNAGRVYRTNSGDGVNKVMLYDVFGNNTAEIRSASLNLRNVNFYTAAQADFQGAQRTEMVYDALGRLVERRLPTRSEELGGVFAQVQGAHASKVDSTTATVMLGEELKYVGANEVNLTWAPLNGLGAGDIKIELAYTADVYEIVEGLPVKTGSVPANVTRIVSADEGNAGYLLAWGGEPSVSDITGLVVSKKDLNGQWRVVSQLGVSRNTAVVRLPADPAVEVTFETRASGSNWVTRSGGVNFGAALWFDLQNLSVGSHEYRVSMGRPGQAFEVVSQGTLALQSEPLGAIPVAVTFDSNVNHVGRLRWPSPPSITWQTLNYRKVGTTTWSQSDVNTVAGGDSWVDASRLAPGEYEYELLWSTDPQRPPLHSTGVVSVGGNASGPTALYKIEGIRLVDQTEGEDLATVEIHWDAAWPTPTETQVRVRLQGESEWLDLPLDVQSLGGDHWVVLEGFEPGIYEFEINAIDSVDGETLIAHGSGEITLATAPGSGGSLIVLTDTSADQVNVPFRIEGGRLSWPSPGDTTYGLKYRPVTPSGDAPWQEIDYEAIRPDWSTYQGESQRAWTDISGLDGSFEFHWTKGSSPGNGEAVMAIGRFILHTRPTQLRVDSLVVAKRIDVALDGHTLSFAPPSAGLTGAMYYKPSSTAWWQPELFVPLGNGGSFDIDTELQGDYDFVVIFARQDGAIVEVGGGCITLAPGVAPTLKHEFGVPVPIQAEVDRLSWAPMEGSTSVQVRYRPIGTGAEGWFRANAGLHDELMVAELEGVIGDIEYVIEHIGRDAGGREYLLNVTNGQLSRHYGVAGAVTPPTISAAVTDVVLDGHTLRWTPPALGGQATLYYKLASSDAWAKGDFFGPLSDAGYPLDPTWEGEYDFRIVYTVGVGNSLDPCTGMAHGRLTLSGATPPSNLSLRPTTVELEVVDGERVRWPALPDSTLTLMFQRPVGSATWSTALQVERNPVTGIESCGIQSLAGEIEYRLEHFQFNAQGGKVLIGLTTGVIGRAAEVNRLEVIPEQKISGVAVVGNRIEWDAVEGTTAHLFLNVIGDFQTLHTELIDAEPINGRSSYTLSDEFLAALNSSGGFIEFRIGLAQPGPDGLVLSMASGVLVKGTGTGSIDINPALEAVQITEFRLEAGRLIWDLVEGMPAQDLYFNARYRGVGEGPDAPWEGLSVHKDVDNEICWVDIHELDGSYEFRIEGGRDGEGIYALGLMEAHLTRAELVDLSPTPAERIEVQLDGTTLRFAAAPAGLVAKLEFLTTGDFDWDPANSFELHGADSFALDVLAPGRYDFQISYANEQGVIVKQGGGRFSLAAGATALLEHSYEPSSEVKLTADTLSWVPLANSRAGWVSYRALDRDDSNWQSFGYPAGGYNGEPEYVNVSSLFGHFEYRIEHRGRDAQGVEVLLGVSYGQFNRSYAVALELGPTTPAAPVRDIALDGFMLSWTAPAGGASATLYYKTRGSDIWLETDKYEIPSGPTFQIPDDATGEYDFRIVYRDAEGREVSVGSGTVARTEGSPPTLLSTVTTTVAVTDEANRLQWTSLPGSDLAKLTYRKLGDTEWSEARVAERDPDTGIESAALLGQNGRYEYRIEHLRIDGAGTRVLVGLSAGELDCGAAEAPAAVTALADIDVKGLQLVGNTLQWDAGAGQSATLFLWATASDGASQLPLRFDFEPGPAGRKMSFELPEDVAEGKEYGFRISLFAPQENSDTELVAISAGYIGPAASNGGTVELAPDAVIVEFSFENGNVSWPRPTGAVGTPVVRYAPFIEDAQQPDPWYGGDWLTFSGVTARDGLDSMDVSSWAGRFRVRIDYLDASGYTLSTGTFAVAPDAPIPGFWSGGHLNAVEGLELVGNELRWNDGYPYGFGPTLCLWPLDAPQDLQTFDDFQVGTANGLPTGITLPADFAAGRAYGFRIYDHGFTGEIWSIATGVVRPGGGHAAPELVITTPPAKSFAITDTTAQNPNGLSVSIGSVLKATPSGSPTKNSQIQGAVIHQQVDRWGNVLSTSDPRMADWKTVFEWNHNNQLVLQRQPAANGGIGNGPETRLHYDGQGRRIAVTDALGHVNAERYDLAGNLVEEHHADGGKITHRYNSFGDKVFTRDAVGNEALRQGDAIRAEGHSTRFDHDDMGRLTTVTRGAVNVYSTDANLTLSGPSWENAIESYAYDEAGRRLSKLEGTGSDLTRRVYTSYAYDHAGHVVSTSRGQFLDILAGPLSTTLYGYNVYGHKNLETDALGNTATWVTDAFGRTAQHKDFGGHLLTFEYNDAGQLESQTGSHGVQKTFEYDDAGQLTSIVDTSSVEGEVGPSLHITTYAYDAAGNRVLERTERNGKVYQDNHLAYDALGRLRLVADGRVQMTFEYDRAGNRTFIGTQLSVANVGGDAEENFNSERHFSYDAMNRVLVADGVLDATTGKAAIAQGQGHEVSYDLNGNRISDRFWGKNLIINGGGDIVLRRGPDGEVQEYLTPTRYAVEDGFLTEIYAYDHLNRLTGVERGQVQLDSRKYDAQGRVVSAGPTHLPKAIADKLNENTNAAQSVGLEQRISQYDAMGRLLKQKTMNSDGTSKFSVDNHHIDAVGNVLGYSVTSHSANGAAETTHYTSQVKAYEGYVQTELRAIAEDGRVGITSSRYDASGNLIGVQDAEASANNRYFVNDAQGRALFVNQGGNVERQLIVNGEILGRFGVGEEGAAAPSQNPSFKALAEFEFGYQSINGNYPGASPGQYTVRQGDTLQGIARGAYGDSALWYRIAEANGLAGNSDLRVGQTLSIPTGVGGVHNTADTYQPYDPSKISGDMGPTLPVPTAPGAPCGGMGMIIMIVVAIVVTYFTAGAAASYFGPAMANGVAVTAGTAGTVTIAGTTVTAASGMAAMAIGAAAGSVASQAVGVAIGVQDKISWKGVALSALGGAITAGIGSTGLGSGLSQTGQAAVQAATSNAITQGIGVVTGLQDKFSWRSVAASAVGAGVGRAVSGSLHNALSTSDSLSQGMKDFITRLGSGMAAGATAAVMRGGKVSIQQVAVDAFGNAIGESVAGAMQSAPDQSDAETARLNRYAGAARDAEYLQQSDSILNRKAGDAWTAMREQEWIGQSDAILQRKGYERLEGINGMDAQSDAWVAANGPGKVGRRVLAAVPSRNALKGVVGGSAMDWSGPSFSDFSFVPQPVRGSTYTDGLKGAERWNYATSMNASTFREKASLFLSNALSSGAEGTVRVAGALGRDPLGTLGRAADGVLDFAGDVIGYPLGERRAAEGMARRFNAAEQWLGKVSGQVGAGDYANLGAGIPLLPPVLGGRAFLGELGPIDVTQLRRSYGVNEANLAVEATFEHRGQVFYDVNQTARNQALATDARLPIYSEARANLGAPNQTFASAHAEIGAMAQSFDAGVRGGEATLTILGKDACSFCVSDVKRMALQLQLDELTVVQPSSTITFNGPKDFAPVKLGGRKW